MITALGLEEAALPSINESEDRFDFYAQKVLGPDGRFVGDRAMAWLLAMGAAESGLQNLALGNNALNGTPPSSEAFLHVGVGWGQADTLWIEKNVAVGNWEAELDWVWFREDPTRFLDYIADVPGYVTYRGDWNWINEKLWATHPAKIDPFMERAEAAVRCTY